MNKLTYLMLLESFKPENVRNICRVKFWKRVFINNFEDKPQLVANIKEFNYKGEQ